MAIYWLLLPLLLSLKAGTHLPIQSGRVEADSTKLCVDGKGYPQSEKCKIVIICCITANDGLGWIGVNWGYENTSQSQASTYLIGIIDDAPHEGSNPSPQLYVKVRVNYR